MNLISWKRYARVRNCKKSAKHIKQKIWEKTLKEEIRGSQIVHSALNWRAEKPTQRDPHLI